MIPFSASGTAHRKQTSEASGQNEIDEEETRETSRMALAVCWALSAIVVPSDDSSVLGVGWRTRDCQDGKIQGPVRLHADWKRRRRRGYSSLKYSDDKFEEACSR
jgi:hypothetical protein